MAPICKIKKSYFNLIFLISLLFSCEKDANLFAEHVMEEEIAVLDDNFRIPSHRISVLDVFSNDNYISSGNTRIVDISTPANGKIRINEDNTITYIPETANTAEIVVASATDETHTEDKNTEEVDADANLSPKASTEEDAAADETMVEAVPVVPAPKKNANEKTSVEETETEETDTEEVTLQEILSQEEAPLEVPLTVETAQEAINHEDTPTESTPVENAFGEEEKTTTEDTSTSEEVSEELEQKKSSSLEESPDVNSTEEEITEEIVEDTFTYTTETENEDGSKTIETATVTVEVESSTPDQEDGLSKTKISSENDYWRDAVIAGSRLLDDNYYDLDTGEIYAKEVNLQRGQVESYIEHENCPQRIKDKWDNRIEIYPSDVNGNQKGLQAVFKAHPEGSLFYLRAGVYQDQKNAILSNEQDVVGAYGAILDGSGIQGNSEESTRAIRSLKHGYICNLKVREYPTWNDTQNPRNPRGVALEAIQNGAILNCEVHSHNKAISVVYGSKAMWNKFTAGRLGINGYGYHDPNHPNRRGTIVKYNEWYNCNFNNYDQHHEAGGSKFVKTDGTILSHNYVHDNPTGSGIWNDGDNRESEIYKNVIINTYRSIFIEISHTANIHHNTIEHGKGFGAIYISNSQGNKVHDNFIRWSVNGISVRDISRGTSQTFPGLAWRGINNEIYGNHIWQRAGGKDWTTGKVTLFAGDIDPNNTSNRWHNNHYYVDDNANGAALFPEVEPFEELFIFAKRELPSNHQPLSWEVWKKHAGEENSTLEYAPSI